MEKVRGNGYNLLLWRFQLDTKGKFFTMRIISHWNNLPREVVGSPTLDTFKIQLDRVLSHLVRLCFCQERLAQMIPEVPSNLVFYDSFALFHEKAMKKL